MKREGILVLSFLIFFSADIVAQPYDLKGCLSYAVENNHNIRKSQLDLEKSLQARREVLGALLPQISGTGSLTNNIKKAKFVMPNFMNEFLPPALQDPNADKYMIIEMGTNYTAGIGAALNQQILNFSLFNALDIAEVAGGLTALSVEAREEDVIAQTATLFYTIQVTEYAASLFGKSIDIIDTMLVTMEGSYASGLVKKVDLDRLRVTRTNLMTQRNAIQSAIEVQKNLLKLQMGLGMNEPLEIALINLEVFERQSQSAGDQDFDLSNQTSYKLMGKQADLMKLQRRSAVYEALPVLTGMINYNYNGVCDDFFRGETNYWYGTSMAGLSLRVPLFGGMSRHAKVKQADIEIMKINEDAASLELTLNMAYKNALMKLEDNRRTIQWQRENMALAEEVCRITESNFSQGLSSMSDVLNANNSLVQSQMSYADALNNFMKAWIDLQKAGGTIRTLMQ